MLPILGPISVPKIMKYKVIVIAGGRSVCGHIRVNLLISFTKMVRKAIHCPL